VTRLIALSLVGVVVLAACGAPSGSGPVSSPSHGNTAPSPTASRTAAPTPASTVAPTIASSPTAPPSPVAALIAKIDPFRMDDHLRALVAAGSRDVRHPGHAKAVAYLYEQLRAIPGLEIQTHLGVYQGIRLENILAIVDPAGPVPASGWTLVSAHYDSISNRTPGWDARTTPAPGADDNATGTAALLEYARILAADRAQLRNRIVLAFFDGEELFYKGSADFVSKLQRPFAYKAAINLDMVGFNPLADRLDLLWYLPHSAPLRDRVTAVNQRHAIGISPLNAQYAADGSTIMDAAPFGLAGIPSIALCQRYGENDATFPGNSTFHTRNDTEANVTNKRLWLKAAKLTLAVALELALE
jgi:hypothetical protein